MHNILVFIEKEGQYPGYYVTATVTWHTSGCIRLLINVSDDREYQQIFVVFINILDLRRTK